ncbi:YhfC family intramembrane metalloprotease [Virgibacillus sp. NKC19-16]|uniref:YhfC family intramembrane metalloprotease n=1 Tax=Virgibacillus salidurans TaxID=2831673 RepID=UPI0021075963|nr:YhfC family glutamic-type intramembrane protease [Virgibacillus sp. NKC19-16]UJL46812.1 YhfC family intramembrane metalloprotease [Virgibacillus sp. NKC19-16]
MIDTVSIIFMALEGILAIGVPLFCTIYFIRKYRISWKPILIGIMVFIVFSQILEQMLHRYVFGINPSLSEWLKNPYLFALYGCLATGVFEEIGRYIGFRYLLKKYRDWKDGIAYGIGHGGVEVLLFVGE